MIPRSRSGKQPPARWAPPATGSWRQSLARTVRDPAELLRLLELPEGALPEDFLRASRRSAGAFPLRVPRAFAERMEKGNARDPLLLQVLPVGAEMEVVPGFSTDPVGELGSSPTPGLLTKYQGRALLVLTGACAVHCRYCFRRHFPYGEQAAGRSQLTAALSQLAADPTIEEVLLSGGDPLSLSDEPLGEIVRALAEIPHLRRLRVHTRTAVVLPERVDGGLLAALCGTRLRPVMVVHVNHAREIDPELGAPEDRGAFQAACARLREAGVMLLNQSVLLRGVNDRPEVLAELSRALFEAGVLPYYLHLLDRVAGAAHFEVGEAEARGLVGQLRALLPGYLVPRLVREVPGAPCKVPVAEAPGGPTDWSGR